MDNRGYLMKNVWKLYELISEISKTPAAKSLN